MGDKNERANERLLSGTFADIAAPELPWEEMPPAPVPRLDGAAVQIKNLFYVFAGYGTIDYVRILSICESICLYDFYLYLKDPLMSFGKFITVARCWILVELNQIITLWRLMFIGLCIFVLQVHSHVDIFNLSDNTWGGRFDMPKEMGHSHLGVASDGRYIYVISGQYGPQCRGPTARSFVLDTETKKWGGIPPLPSPRYVILSGFKLMLDMILVNYNLAVASCSLI